MVEDLINDLSEELIVTEHKRIEKTIYINCEIKRKQSKCPYCNKFSSNVHSKYLRTLDDLPIQGKEVKLLLTTRKFFCLNQKCKHKTFGERFEFVEPKAVKTKRLIDYIKSIGLRDNSMDAVRNLKDFGIKVSSNTVLRVVKKKQKQ